MVKLVTLARQGTGAWLNERVGCLTASRMAEAMDYLKTGRPSAKRMDLMTELLAERMTGDACPHFVTAAMQWGIDTEPAGKAAYMAARGVKLSETGFHTHPTIEHCGASPDGLIGADGGFELKCPTTKTHIGWLRAGVVPDEHKPQMLLGMACTGRTWWDFASFDPRVPKAQQLFVRRFEPDRRAVLMVEAEAVKFLYELEQMFTEVTQCVAIA